MPPRLDPYWDGKWACAICYAWRDGECWSVDGLEEGEVLTEPVRYTSADQHCEAWYPRADLEGPLPPLPQLSPLARMAPSFYDFQTGKWNHKHFRVRSVYRLLRAKRIGKARALELLAKRHCAKELRALNSTIDGWKEFAIKDMLP